MINLDKESEPDIYAAIKRNALLENVIVDANGKIDFSDNSATENTRRYLPHRSHREHRSPRIGCSRCEERDLPLG